MDGHKQQVLIFTKAIYVWKTQFSMMLNFLEDFKNVTLAIT